MSEQTISGAGDGDGDCDEGFTLNTLCWAASSNLK